MGYRDSRHYVELENLIKMAGVNVIYDEVFDDHIDGAIWARADVDGLQILMPDTEEFPDPETACLVLGHEMGHILSGLDSPDLPSERRKNEAVCDLIGVYLTKLAELIAGNKIEMEMREASNQGAE